MAETAATQTGTHPGIRVFVYGTLKSGHSNAGALRGADYLGRCRLTGGHKLVDLGFYPGLVMDPNPKAEQRTVLGEVYRISREQLAVLDMIEGHPDYYARMKVTTPWKGAWAYYLPTAYLDAREPVESVDGIQVWRPTDEEIAYVRNCASAGE